MALGPPLEEFDGEVPDGLESVVADLDVYDFEDEADEPRNEFGGAAVVAAAAPPTPQVVVAAWELDDSSTDEDDRLSLIHI
eukprot:7414446-Lingulodinium_polyedra.AAC.1